MLASLLLQLQQGQAEIARTTQGGLKTLADGIAQSAKRPGIVDVKGIGKPDVLKGTHEEVQPGACGVGGCPAGPMDMMVQMMQLYPQNQQQMHQTQQQLQLQMEQSQQQNQILLEILGKITAGGQNAGPAVGSSHAQTGSGGCSGVGTGAVGAGSAPSTSPSDLNKAFFQSLRQQIDTCLPA